MLNMTALDFFVRPLTKDALDILANRAIINPGPAILNEHLQVLQRMSSDDKRIVGRLTVCHASTDIEEQESLRWASLGITDHKFVINLKERLYEGRNLLNCNGKPLFLIGYGPLKLPQEPMHAFDMMKVIINRGFTRDPSVMPQVSKVFLGTQLYQFYERERNYAIVKSTEDDDVLELFLAEQRCVSETAYLDHQRVISNLIDDYYIFHITKRGEVEMSTAMERLAKIQQAIGLIDKEKMLTPKGVTYLKNMVTRDEAVLDEYLGITNDKALKLRGKEQEKRHGMLTEIIADYMELMDAQA